MKIVKVSSNQKGLTFKVFKDMFYQTFNQSGHQCHLNDETSWEGRETSLDNFFFFCSLVEKWFSMLSWIKRRLGWLQLLSLGESVIFMRIPPGSGTSIVTWLLVSSTPIRVHKWTVMQQRVFRLWYWSLFLQTICEYWRSGTLCLPIYY